MKENKKNKRPLLALTVVAAVLLVGGTIAYFTTSVDFDNVFETATYKTTTTEEFTAPDNWKPGEEVENIVTTTNEGTMPVAVRVSYTEEWKDSEGNALDPQPENKVTINLDNTTDWTLSNGYYYYNKALAPEATTTSFMKSVTLNSDAITGDSTTCTTSDDGLTKTCESTDALTGSTYTLKVKTETVQFDAYKTVWATDVAITE